MSINIEMAVADSTTYVQQLLQRVAQPSPLLHLISTEENRHKYLTQCVPLNKAATKGDWKEAKKILEKDPTLLTSAITNGCATVLHIAVGADHVHFVEELLKIMEPDHLELQDNKGNTAFCFAAAIGNVHIAEIMRKKNNLLPTIRGGGGFTPLHLAVLQRRSEMAWYLFPKSKEILQEEDWITVFLFSINSALYDLALEILNEKQSLAFERDNNETGLHVLARRPLDCGCQSRKNLLHFFSGMKDAPALKLMKRMWEIFLTLDQRKMMETMTQPYSLISIAAEAGNFEFLSVVMSTYPEFVWELNTLDQSVIVIAVLNRHASIFNLIHEIGSIKLVISTFEDDEDNNLLHSVAKLAPPDRLNTVSGAALQMMLELSWFEGVKKIMNVSCEEMKNSEGMTPRELFTKEHAELLKQAESWMKKTANSCMIVSTLIATGVFSATFSLPGGNNDNTGSPNYLEKPLFHAFALSNALALISSSTSILIFLSILIFSRYTEDDFRKSVPLKLLSGLLTLFISIISMMVAFSSAFFITFYHGAKWVPPLISGFALLPISLFMYLQFPLSRDIVYICSSLFRASERMIH